MLTLSLDRVGALGVGTIGLLLLTVVPAFGDFGKIVEFSQYLIYGILAISLAFVWGFGGIFSFGQASFFGLGGYSYAVIAFNMSDTTLAFVGGIVVPGAFALLLGYFMFYGRVSSVYIAVVTLTVTLIFYKFIGHTAGYEWSIGKAHLGGFNGMPSIPPINLPGDPSVTLFPVALFRMTVIFLLLFYFGLRFLLGTQFGRVIQAIRENELRAELLGYDPRLYKTLTFGIGGAIAGIGGILFANWNAYISPTVFTLGMSSQIIIWVIVGGLGTLFGPIVGAVLLSYLAIQLGAQQINIVLFGAQRTLDVNLILGAILLVFVLAVPQGVMPQARRQLVRWMERAAVAWSPVDRRK